MQLPSLRHHFLMNTQGWGAEVTHLDVWTVRHHEEVTVISVSEVRGTGGPSKLTVGKNMVKATSRKVSHAGKSHNQGTASLY